MGEQETDQRWMQHALALAALAAQQGEVPVGCVIVQNECIVGEGYNQPITRMDPTAHAEIVALRSAAEHVQNYRLPNTTLYVTLEPCTMCCGALIHARVGRLVYGASEPKAGAVSSQLTLFKQAFFNHRVEVVAGVLEKECAAVLKRFFQQRRHKA